MVGMRAIIEKDDLWNRVKSDIHTLGAWGMTDTLT